MRLLDKVADDVAKEIGSKTREFYEFVLPPIDMVTKDSNLTITADMPGFEKKDINVTLRGRMLRIQACKAKEAWLDAGDQSATKKADGDDNSAMTIHYAQRPSFVDKKIRLPVPVYGSSSKPWEKDDDDNNDKKDKPVPTATYKDGMLLVSIPTRERKGKGIPVE